MLQQLGKAQRLCFSAVTQLQQQPVARPLQGLGQHRFLVWCGLGKVLFPRHVLFFSFKTWGFTRTYSPATYQASKQG
eukprot:m.221111 g.221111  ORF g.221111 m.221111 type:complete len:77 (+) comp22284_c3_seq4:1895-2125(+)